MTRPKGWLTHRVKEILREGGLDTSYQTALAVLQRDGESCSEPTFSNCKKVIRAELNGYHEPADPIVAVEKIPEPPPPRDWFIDLARMNDAVEKVGGITRARLLLDQLEAAGKVLA